MKRALLVLDTQNGFFQEDNPNLAEFRRVLANINGTIALFREHNLPIVFIQQTSARTPPGSFKWAIYPDVNCRPEDLRTRKGHMNAFWQSDLEELLHSQGVEGVVVTGFMSEYCVLSAARGAEERGFQSLILRDAIAALDDARTQFVYDISDCISLEELRAELIKEKAALAFETSQGNVD